MNFLARHGDMLGSMRQVDHKLGVSLGCLARETLPQKAINMKCDFSSSDLLTYLRDMEPETF
jgi:hypothetical protein